MNHQLSASDLEFRKQFESCSVPVSDFDHRAHLRLAYIYLAEDETEAAYQLMRSALHAYLEHLGIDMAKYHDTITRAWILAVRHFMEVTPQSISTESFIDKNPKMLDSKIMMTHYSAEVLFSDEARAKFVEPDLDPIPRYDG